MLAYSQTVEDGLPRQGPTFTLCNEGSPREFVRVEMTVRQPVLMPSRLVIRASQKTLEITASIERIRVE